MSRKSTHTFTRKTLANSMLLFLHQNYKPDYSKLGFINLEANDPVAQPGIFEAEQVAKIPQQF